MRPLPTGASAPPPEARLAVAPAHRRSGCPAPPPVSRNLTHVASAGRAPRSRAVDRNCAPFTMSLSSFSHGSARCCLPQKRYLALSKTRLRDGACVVNITHTTLDIGTTRHNTVLYIQGLSPVLAWYRMSQKQKGAGAYWASLGGARTMVGDDDTTAQQRRKDTAATTTSPRNLSQSSLRSPLLPGYPCTRLRCHAGSVHAVGVLLSAFQNLALMAHDTEGGKSSKGQKLSKAKKMIAQLPS